MEFLHNILARIDIGRFGAFSKVLSDPRGLFVLLVTIVVILYGLSVGKTKAMVSLLSVYVAYILTVMFPFLPWLQEQVIMPEGAPVLMVLLFFVLYLTTFLILSHSIVKGRLTLGEISIWKVVLISVVQLGLLGCVTASLLPADFAAKTFGPAYQYLAGQRALWAWAVASLLIMPFMKSSHRD
jgi:hypothetical protein